MSKNQIRSLEGYLGELTEPRPTSWRSALERTGRERRHRRPGLRQEQVSKAGAGNLDDGKAPRLAITSNQYKRLSDGAIRSSNLELIQAEAWAEALKKASDVAAKNPASKWIEDKIRFQEQVDRRFKMPTPKSPKLASEVDPARQGTNSSRSARVTPAERDPAERVAAQKKLANLEGRNTYQLISEVEQSRNPLQLNEVGSSASVSSDQATRGRPKPGSGHCKDQAGSIEGRMLDEARTLENRGRNGRLTMVDIKLLLRNQRENLRVDARGRQSPARAAQVRGQG